MFKKRKIKLVLREIVKRGALEEKLRMEIRKNQQAITELRNKLHELKN